MTIALEKKFLALAGISWTSPEPTFQAAAIAGLALATTNAGIVRPSETNDDLIGHSEEHIAHAYPPAGAGTGGFGDNQRGVNPLEIARRVVRDFPRGEEIVRPPPPPSLPPPPPPPAPPIVSSDDDDDDEAAVVPARLIHIHIPTKNQLAQYVDAYVRNKFMDRNPGPMVPLPRDVYSLAKRIDDGDSISSARSKETSRRRRSRSLGCGSSFLWYRNPRSAVSL